MYINSIHAFIGNLVKKIKLLVTYIIDSKIIERRRKSLSSSKFVKIKFF